MDYEQKIAQAITVWIKMPTDQTKLWIENNAFRKLFAGCDKLFMTRCVIKIKSYYFEGIFKVNH